MNFSGFAFFSFAFSTRSRILFMLDSLNSFKTLISRTLSLFITPALISSPFLKNLGTDSPVKGDVST